jgi:hypothetical protein
MKRIALIVFLGLFSGIPTTLLFLEYRRTGEVVVWLFFVTMLCVAVSLAAILGTPNKVE